ncbi:MAG: hypothetical protein AMXMBFR7_37800 [Planctomycetota bacterium]|nr:hypothetical protein [Planctomycetota bacterium]
MAFKAFPAATGSGNTVFEGDVLNGYTTPDGKKVRLQFYGNDRGYTAAAYLTDHEGAKALLQELESLAASNLERGGIFSAESNNKNFRLSREFESSPLILFLNGNDRMQGRTFHRGDAAAMQKVLEEFKKVIQTIDDVVAGKGPGAEPE